MLVDMRGEVTFWLKCLLVIEGCGFSETFLSFPFQVTSPNGASYDVMLTNVIKAYSKQQYYSME